MGLTFKQRLFRLFWHVPGFMPVLRAYRRRRNIRRSKWRQFAVVWTRPNGEEVARWVWKVGEPAPTGMSRYSQVTEKLIETHYGDGEYRFHVKLDPDNIAGTTIER